MALTEKNCEELVAERRADYLAEEAKHTATPREFKVFAQYISAWIERDNTDYAVYRLTVAGHEHIGFSPSRKQINEIAQLVIASLNPDVADEFISAMRIAYAEEKPIIVSAEDIGIEIRFLHKDKHGVAQILTETLVGFIDGPCPVFVSSNGRRDLIGCASEIIEARERCLASQISTGA